MVTARNVWPQAAELGNCAPNPRPPAQVFQFRFMIGVLKVGLDISLVTSGLTAQNLKTFAPVMLRYGIGVFSAGVGTVERL